MNHTASGPLRRLSPPTLTLRTSALTALALTVALTGCAGAGSADPDEQPSAEEPAAESRWAYDWTSIPYSAPLVAGTFYDSFSAGGEFWVWDDQLATTVHGTRDGVTWRTLDLTEHGVPAEAVRGHQGCDSLSVIDWGDRFSLLFYTDHGQSHPESIFSRLWLVDVAGETVTVSDSMSNGLETMPPDEAGEAYRTSCVSGGGELAGARVLIGEGQWWRPFATGNQNPWLAVERGANWTVHAAMGAPFFGDQVMPVLAGVVGHRAVVVSSHLGVDEGLRMWSSADGIGWQEVTVPGPSLASRDAVMTVTPHGAIIAGGSRGVEDDGHIWATVDGVTWHHTPLFDDEWKLRWVQADERGLAVGGWRISPEATEGGVWLSADGVTWTPLHETEALEAVVGPSIPHAGGLIWFGKEEIRVSGLDWKPAGG